MQYSQFVVNESPFCVWEWDLAKRNLEFINSIDYTFFEYLARVHSEALDQDKNKQHAALSLRTAYSHGLETFFALLFAALQAPDCVIGWLHKYQIEDMENLIHKVSKRQPILTKIPLYPITWKTISYSVLVNLVLEDGDKEKKIKDGFSRAWKRLAEDFVNKKIQQEYNSVKHGLRARAGGFYLAFGVQDVPGVPAPSERMHLVAHSEFGSSFFIPERIDNDKLNIRIKRHSRNWRPENFLYGLLLLSYSIQNDAGFEAPWTPTSAISDLAIDNVIKKFHIQPFSKEEIIACYKDNNPSTPPS